MPGPITRVAELDGGRRFGLPGWSLRLGRGARTRYLLLGDPDFRHPGGPWRYVEQMGAAHRLEAAGVRLTAVTHKQGSWVTEVRFMID
jgi:hypothetical protein